MYVNIGSGVALLPSSNKALPELISSPYWLNIMSQYALWFYVLYILTLFKVQCGAVIARSIFSKSLKIDTP